MSFSPKDSAIRVTQSLEERIAAATSQSEIQQILRTAALDQKLVVPDAFDHNILLPVESTASTRFEKTVEVGGVEKTFSGSSELEVERAVNAYMREIFSESSTTQQEQPRGNDGRFQSQDDAQLEAVRKSELELQFKRGDIDTATYLAQSGAIDEYLEAQGVDMNALRETTGKRFEQSWATATEEFLRSAAGADWVGGEENKEMIGRLIQENGLTGSPSAETLAAAWAAMKEHGLTVTNESAEAETSMGAAQSREELQSALERFRRAHGATGSSGVFGR